MDISKGLKQSTELRFALKVFRFVLFFGEVGGLFFCVFFVLFWFGFFFSFCFAFVFLVFIMLCVFSVK